MIGGGGVTINSPFGGSSCFRLRCVVSLDLLDYRLMRAQLLRAQMLLRGKKPGRTLQLPLAYLRKKRSFLNAFLVNYNWCMDNKMYLSTMKRAGWSLLCASNFNQFRRQNYWPVTLASLNHGLRNSTLCKGRHELMGIISTHLLVIRWNDLWVVENKRQIEILFLSRTG